MVGLDLMIILGVFTVACAYFSQRTGYKQGVNEGMESTLKLLEAGGYIKVVEDESTGLQEIQRVPNGNNTNT
jgi:hypothetical protein